MFLQKSKKFHGVLSFEASGPTLNYRFSFIHSKLTSKFETCINTYSWKYWTKFGREWTKYGYSRDF